MGALLRILMSQTQTITMLKLELENHCNLGMNLDTYVNEITTN